MRNITPGQVDYFEVLKGKPKVKVKGKTFDKAFGKEAYELALRDAKDEGLANGATEASIEADFNRWWDEQAAAEDPKGFGRRVIPRSEFQEGIIPEAAGIPDDSVRLESAPDVRLDSIWPQLSDDQKKQILNQLDENPDKTEILILAIWPSRK